MLEFLIAVAVVLWPLVIWPALWYKLFASDRQFSIRAMAILVAGFAVLVSMYLPVLNWYWSE